MKLHEDAYKFLKKLNNKPYYKDQVILKNSFINDLISLELIKYRQLSEDGAPLEPLVITFKGKCYLSETKQETRRFWLSLLIPHPLNVLFSVISAILTVYAMNYFGLIK